MSTAAAAIQDGDGIVSPEEKVDEDTFDRISPGF